MRKRKKKYRTRQVNVMLTEGEYAALTEKCGSSVCRTLSDYVRTRLFDDSIKIYYRNQSVDELLPVAGRIGEDLGVMLRDWTRLVKNLRDRPVTQEITQALAFLLSEEFYVRQTVNEIKSMLLKTIEDGRKDQGMRGS